MQAIRMKKLEILQKRISQNILLTLISIIILFLLSELIVRLAGYYPHKASITPPYLFTNHPVTWWSLTPNYNKTIKIPDGVVTYAINSQGLRAPEDIEKCNLPQLYFIGDSFTFGAGINEEYTFPHILNNLFKNQSINMRTVNLGVTGFGTCQCYNRLVEYSTLLGQPQIVVYLFCPNDPVDNITGKKQIVWGIRIDDNRKYKKFLAIVGHCYFNSRIVAFVLDRIYDKQFNPRKQKTKKLHQNNLPIEQRQDFTMTRECLSRLINWTRQRNIRLLVITTSPSIYSQPLFNYLQSNQAPMLEAAEIFKHSNPDSLPVNLIEGHWNQLGHQLIATEIAKFLMQEKWL